MDMQQTLSLVLQQIISKMEMALKLDIDNHMDLRERNYISEEFIEKATHNPDDFSGIFDIEYAFSLLFQLRIIGNEIISDIADVDTNYIQAMEKKERDLEESLSVCNTCIMHLSSIIDTALFNGIQLVNIEKHNYFGFKRETYLKFMTLAQYKNTAEVVSKKAYYKLFTGGCIISDQYEPMYSVAGVVNKAPKDSTEYRLHRILCMLIKINKRDLASVVCRLLLTQASIRVKSS